jgi:hypothetical protein
MIKTIQDSMDGGEFKPCDKLKDSIVFVNVFAQGK